MGVSVDDHLMQLGSWPLSMELDNFRPLKCLRATDYTKQSYCDVALYCIVPLYFYFSTLMDRFVSFEVLQLALNLMMRSGIA